MTVWVVLGERGEFSARDVWISGIFETEKEAEEAVLSALERYRVHASWVESLNYHHDNLMDENPCPGLYEGESYDDRQKRMSSYFDSIDFQSNMLAGPEPKQEEYGERFTIELIEIRAWDNGRDSACNSEPLAEERI